VLRQTLVTTLGIEPTDSKGVLAVGLDGQQLIFTFQSRTQATYHDGTRIHYLGDGKPIKVAVALEPALLDSLGLKPASGQGTTGKATAGNATGARRTRGAKPHAVRRLPVAHPGHY
jgi:hypothetical protein